MFTAANQRVSNTQLSTKKRSATEPQLLVAKFSALHFHTRYEKRSSVHGSAVFE